MNCEQLSRWFADTLEAWIRAWYRSALQQCTEAQRWFENLRHEIEDWSRVVASQCREQACAWACFCCNKWFCWLVELLTRIVNILLEAIEHVIEAVCKLLVTLLWLLLEGLARVLTWIVLAIVCLLQALCPLLILLGALALLVVWLAVLSLLIPVLAAPAAALIPPAAGVAVVALLLAGGLCEASRCRVMGAIGWSLKWAVLLGAALALVFQVALVPLGVVIYGSLTAALIILLEPIPCQLPRLLSLP